MVYEDIEVSGSISISGSFSTPAYVGTGSYSSPRQGSMLYNTTDDFTYVYNGTQWEVIGNQIAPDLSLEYLVVAGGAGNATSPGNNGAGNGGGGAGGLLSSSISTISSGSSISVVVGSGGTGQAQGGTSSMTSLTGTSFSTISAVGGGAGGQGRYATTTGNDTDGFDGGSGGGGGNASAGDVSGGAATPGQGNPGGAGRIDQYQGGGGGGADTAGTDATSTVGGDGGNGLQSSITGTPTYYAGGGGGSSYNLTAGSGGLGGGSNGKTYAGGQPSNGTANTGGGGGGIANRALSDVSGGSGVVILAYDSGSFNCAGGIVGDAGNGRKYNQFYSSGDFKVGSISDFSIVSSNLVSHFDAGDFTSRGTSTWTDLSGNSYNLTAASSPSLGNNFYYDFSTSYFTRTDSAHEFSNGNFTVEVWVKFDSLSAGDTIASKRSTGSPGIRNWLLGHNASGLVYFLQYHSATEYSYPQTGNGVITTGTWYHIAVTGDASTIKIYVNGAQEASSPFITTGVSGTGTPLELGRRGTNGGHQYLDGQIAQFRAYDVGLSVSEVLQNYNATKTNFV